MNYNPRKLIVIAIVCSFAAGSTIRAGALSSTSSVSRNETTVMSNARLSIRRSADFGTDIYLTVFIDGAHVTTLGQNEGYEATVRPGHHVLSIGTTPNPYGTVLSSRNVTMKSGQIYTFTALWGDTLHATLELPGAAIVRVTQNS
jgi:hypothetical protein